MPLVKNKRTGVIANVPAHYVGHSVLGKDLELITDEVIVEDKKETKFKKEQPAPVVEVEMPELEISIEENKE
jgi:hypothetical protein